MRSTRCCSRNGCDHPAVATLTYIYADSTAVVGPLAERPEPHTYDLCQGHAHGLTAPRGWVLVRHDGDLTPAPPPVAITAAPVPGTCRQAVARPRGPPRPSSRPAADVTVRLRA